ncbi:right-handed parallel beta-helix repeat-containing protein [Brachybacterium sp. GCM10030267]|uniref:pectate lyase family protein n=1 Tax=Brachybacterium sp. GCM10030267 TaxID=3273381 RepID=UPI0036088F20
MPSVPRRSLPALAGASVGAAAVLAGTAPALARPTATTPDGVLALMRVPTGRSGAGGGRVWSPRPTGFASVPTPELPEGTTGGLGGRVVTVTTADALAEAIAADEPTVVLVSGTIEFPSGTITDVSANTSILGVGRGAEIVGGGLRLLEVSNVIIRNLTVRDSFVAGDWDGKFETNDNDGIRVDTSHHVWIDHCEFARLGDGQVDIRKDSTDVTVSWSLFRDHNKTLGVGWTDNLVTTLTLHHNRFSNVHQRNGSIDQVRIGHVYNCWLAGASSYGMASRGATELLIEHSVFDAVRNPIGTSDEQSRVAQNGNLRTDSWGDWEDTGIDVDPADHYDYDLDPVDQVRDLLTRHAGPHGRTERTPRRLHVSQDGTGDVSSIHAAVGAAWRSPHPVEIIVHPGIYREVISIWPGCDGLEIRGASGDPADVVVTYDKPATDWATVTVFARDVVLAALTLENAYEDDTGGDRAAYPLRSIDDTLRLEDVQLTGGPWEISDPRL